METALQKIAAFLPVVASRYPGVEGYNPSGRERRWVSPSIPQTGSRFRNECLFFAVWSILDPTAWQQSRFPGRKNILDTVDAAWRRVAS